jgi:hypothetical protein
VEVVVEIILDLELLELAKMALLVVVEDQEVKMAGLLLIPAQVLLNMEMTVEMVMTEMAEAAEVELELLVAIRLVVMLEVMVDPGALIQLLELQLHIPVVVADRVMVMVVDQEALVAAEPEAMETVEA